MTGGRTTPTHVVISSTLALILDRTWLHINLDRPFVIDVATTFIKSSLFFKSHKDCTPGRASQRLGCTMPLALLPKILTYVR